MALSDLRLTIKGLEVMAREVSLTLMDREVIRSCVELPLGHYRSNSSCCSQVDQICHRDLVLS